MEIKVEGEKGKRVGPYAMMESFDVATGLL